MKWAWLFAAFAVSPGAGDLSFQEPSVQEAPRDPAAEDLARLLPLARERELNREVAVHDAEERLELWRMILLIDPAHLEARAGFQQARGDLDDARESEQATRAATATVEQGKAEQLRLAENALYGGNLDDAEELIDRVLAADPSDARALSLSQSLQAANRMRQVRFKTLLVGLALLAGALVLAAAGFWWWRRRAVLAEARSAGGALLRVVEGIGLGTLKPIEEGVFRIGAADSEDEHRKNHLVLSDKQSKVSRFHCEIISRDADYLLLDSSTNGTSLNGKPVPRGKQKLLRDGDEIVVAGVSKLKFLAR